MHRGKCGPPRLACHVAPAPGVGEVSKFLKGLISIMGRVPDEAARRNRWATAQVGGWLGWVGLSVAGLWSAADRAFAWKVVAVASPARQIRGRLGGLQTYRQAMLGAVLSPHACLPSS